MNRRLGGSWHNCTWTCTSPYGCSHWGNELGQEQDCHWSVFLLINGEKVAQESYRKPNKSRCWHASLERLIKQGK